MQNKKDSLTVLVGDPDALFRQTFKSEFSSAEVTIHTFSTGASLIAGAQKLTPGLLIINTGLSGPNGLSALDIIRDQGGAAVPVVVIMGSDSVQLQAETVKRNVLYRFLEPVSITDFRDLMHKLETYHV